MTSTQTIIEQLPGKDCGLCGLTSCQKFAEIVTANPTSLDRCPHIATTKSAKKTVSEEFVDSNITWKDHLNRDFDFVLDKFPGESGPRETMLPFNPVNVEKMGIKKGDIIYGRPGWISCGCPVTHVGMVVEDPDYFNGTIVWCIVGPMLARERGINIGYYNTTAYEGIVKTSRATLEIGRRYYFQPRYCMLQWRHCGLVNSIGKTPDGLRVRIEGLWIG
jgi:uncharacterized Fe-S cluster-containing protein